MKSVTMRLKTARIKNKPHRVTSGERNPSPEGNRITINTRRKEERLTISAGPSHGPTARRCPPEPSTDPQQSPLSLLPRREYPVGRADDE